MSFDTFDLAALPRADQSKLMTGTVVPRPIAWVSTIGSAGVNLAPFSYFNVVAVEPCMIMFSVSVPVGPRAGSVKDTLQNLREVPEFVLHLPDRNLAEKMHAYHMVIGEVLLLHARKGLVNARHHVNQDIRAPVSRLAGAGLYSAPTDRFIVDNSD
jgi:flavin reductase (DIM6/NTAB) family NADH-FMN oxidoreductase RutF